MVKRVTMVGVFSIILIAGCGVIPGTGTNAPKLSGSVEKLAGTWSAGGNGSITFGTEGNITDFSLDNVLPDELANIKFDGTLFDLSIPGLGTVQAELSLKSATVNDDGSVEIVYRGQLDASSEIGALAGLADAYVDITMSGGLDNLDNPESFDGSIGASATVLGQTFTIAASGNFTVDKS